MVDTNFGGGWYEIKIDEKGKEGEQNGYKYTMLYLKFQFITPL